MRILKILFVLVISYSCAAMLSSHVSMDLAVTDWTSLWVYFWWAVSLPVVGFCTAFLFMFGILALKGLRS